jgi:hypothetical protein
MTAPATTLLASLKTHLAGITVANGYAVTVASVTTGRSALAGDIAGPYPAITLTPVQDQPDGVVSPQAIFQPWMRTVMLDAALRASDAWDADLDALWDAIRRRLTTWDAGILTAWGTAEMVPPEDGGDLCLLRIPLTYTYPLTFK